MNFNKRHRTAFGAVAFLLVLSASTAEARPVVYGLKLGLGATSFVGSTSSDLLLSNSIGVSGGPFLRVQASRMLWIEPEALFSVKGADERRAAISVDTTRHIDLSYVSVPVLLVIRGNSYSDVQPFAEAGPYVAALLQADRNYPIGGTVHHESLSRNANRLDYGLVLGAGFGNDWLSIEGRFSFGLRPVFRNVEPRDAKNRVYAVIVGLVLR